MEDPTKNPYYYTDGCILFCFLGIGMHIYKGFRDYEKYKHLEEMRDLEQTITVEQAIRLA
jgi:hypothetical protein